MLGFWEELPSLVMWVTHVAICATILSAIGSLAIRVCKKQSAYVRHAVACSFLTVLFLTPALTAIYHWNLLPQKSLPVARMMQPIGQVPEPPVGALPEIVDEVATAGVARPINLWFYTVVEIHL